MKRTGGLLLFCLVLGLQHQRPKQNAPAIEDVLRTPVEFIAGQGFSIRFESASEARETGSFGLNRNSFTPDRQCISTAFLYPAAAK